MGVHIPAWLIVIIALEACFVLTMLLALILFRLWFVVVDRWLHLRYVHGLFIYFCRYQRDIKKIVEERKAAVKWNGGEE